MHPFYWFLFFYKLDICCDYLIVPQVRIHKFLEKTRSHQSKKTEAGDEDSMDNDKQKLRKHVNGLIKRRRLKQVQMLLKEKESGPWGRDTQAKVGFNV